MPNGKVHYALWRKYTTPAMVVSASLVVPVLALTDGAVDKALVVALSSAVGYYFGAVLTPDLDLIGLDRSEALAVKSVIFLPLIAWSTLYARIMQVFGGHRSTLSHLPFFSTFIRLCWFSFPLVMLAHFMGWLGPDYSPYFLGVWFGLGMADTIHALADFMPSFGRQKRRRSSRQTAD